jgi:electron transfer flavoprotein alpha subunit
MSNKILVFLEQRNGEIKKQSLEAARKGFKLSKEVQGEVVGVVLGDQISNLDIASEHGLEKVIHFKNSKLSNYSSTAYAKLISDFVKENNFNLLLFSHTAMGKDLAPIVAAKLKAGYGADCTSIEIKDGNLVLERPIYAGKAIMNFSLNSEVKVLTIRPNTVSLTEDGYKVNLNTDVKEIPDDALDLRCIATEYVKAEGKLDVAEADIIISGGRGMKGPENFYLLEEIAQLLGGAVGASRAVVDAGWRSHSEQVGQTGKTVSPKLYIACGISGAIQHLAGMSSAKCIVAINKDKDAPIFQVADYGIVGDVLEILPVLKEELKKYVS